MTPPSILREEAVLATWLWAGLGEQANHCTNSFDLQTLPSWESLGQAGKFQECVTQSQDCVNSKIAWNIHSSQAQLSPSLDVLVAEQWRECVAWI